MPPNQQWWSYSVKAHTSGIVGTVVSCKVSPAGWCQPTSCPRFVAGGIPPASWPTMRWQQWVTDTGHDTPLSQWVSNMILWLRFRVDLHPRTWIFPWNHTLLRSFFPALSLSPSQFFSLPKDHCLCVHGHLNLCLWLCFLGTWPKTAGFLSSNVQLLCLENSREKVCPHHHQPPWPTQGGLVLPITKVLGSVASLSSASSPGEVIPPKEPRKGPLSVWTRLRLSTGLLTLWTQQA